ncbi:MAG TPA: flagellar biosynthesis protein FliO [Xanthobacteraceae bacterium]|nr:flagellar biosynthesis protein FliO [Xanthobacteraceae bacterium]
MSDFLFGEGYGLRWLFAFLVLVAVIGATAWLVRRFGSERLGGASSRGRQPRLAVIDAATVDSRRRLILIRRDNVEHLLMIGGPTDVVIEPNIIRSATQRDAAPSRPPTAADTLPRPVPLGEGSTWPLQPEPAPMPAPRPQRPPPPPMVEEPAQWQAEAEPPPPAPPTRPSRQPVDPLAGLAAELSRQPPAALPPRLSREREPSREREAPREAIRDREQPREATREAIREATRETARERETPRERDAAREATRERETMREREPVREREVARLPQPQGEGQFGQAAEQNLADMAQRLEAALRRPMKPEALADPKLKVSPAEPMVHAPPEPMVVNAPEPMTLEPRLPRGEAKATREAKPAGQRSSMYDSLEQEMASLLGRPGGKN